MSRSLVGGQDGKAFHAAQELGKHGGMRGQEAPDGPMCPRIVTLSSGQEKGGRSPKVTSLHAHPSKNLEAMEALNDLDRFFTKMLRF
jgi:hypothetical protein